MKHQCRICSYQCTCWSNVALVLQIYIYKYFIYIIQIYSGITRGRVLIWSTGALIWANPLLMLWGKSFGFKHILFHDNSVKQNKDARWASYLCFLSYDGTLCNSIFISAQSAVWVSSVWCMSQPQQARQYVKRNVLLIYFMVSTLFCNSNLQTRKVLCSTSESSCNWSSCIST